MEGLRKWMGAGRAAEECETVPIVPSKAREDSEWGFLQEEKKKTKSNNIPLWPVYNVYKNIYPPANKRHIIKL